MKCPVLSAGNWNFNDSCISRALNSCHVYLTFSVVSIALHGGYTWHRHRIIYTELQQMFVFVLLSVALRIQVTRQIYVYGWVVRWRTIWFYKKEKCSFYSHPTKINMIMKTQVVWDVTLYHMNSSCHFKWLYCLYL
jgi:hypothetical protein